VAPLDAPIPPPTHCALCGHPWSAHFGGGVHAIWVTCCAEPAAGPDRPRPASTASPTLDTDGAAGPAAAGPDPLLAERIAAAGGAALPAVAGLTGPAPVCYCRRSVEDFRREALHPNAVRAARAAGSPASDGPMPAGDHEAAAGAAEPGSALGNVVVLCVTCGAAPAEDTQCRPCRVDRQRAAQARFAARQAQLARDTRRRARGR